MKFISGKEKQKEKIVEAILLNNYNRYYRLAYSYTHNEADAYDIVQNGAVKVIKNSDSLKKIECAQTWIYRIMLNEVFRFYGGKEGKVLSLDDITYEQGDEDVYEDFDLQAALEQLSPKDKVIVTLRYFDDLKIEDIAEILEENVNTVKSRLYRSLKKLRVIMEE